MFKNRSRNISAIILFAAAATILLMVIRAATNNISLESEQASTSNLQVANDTAASNGSYIRFAGGNSTANGRFYIVGKDIIDPDGNIFYPIGANAAIKLFNYPYVFEGNNGGANQHIAEIKEWNWNTIRATLICDNDSGTPSFDQLVAGLKQEVPKLTAQKIVVMLECHDLTGKNPQLNSAKELAVRKFWDRMAVEFKDDPYVWFNIFNEPWNKAPDATYSTIHSFYVDRIRATGAENLIFIDAPSWGQGLEYLAETNLGSNLANGKCNVAFEWHAYGAFKGQQGTYQQFETAFQQILARKLVVVVGEYGIALPQTSGNAGPWAWNVSGFEHATKLGPKYGIGLLWWHATGDTSYFTTYALKNDRSGYWSGGSGNNLTGPGQTFWNASQNAPNLGKFNGNLSQSNCPSQQ